MINGKTPKYVADTWRQAELKQVPICVWKDTSLHSYVKKKYPDAILVETITKRKGYEYLNEGKCKIVSDTMQSFRSFQRSSALNGDCSLAIVSSPDVEEKAGFATRLIFAGILPHAGILPQPQSKCKVDHCACLHIGPLLGL